MLFQGIGRTFSTVDERQYEMIGAFWEKLSEIYGRKNLRGLGYNWTETSIDYVIGLKNGKIDGQDTCVQLPDKGWKSVNGKTEKLSNIYSEIYKAGELKYEIETFDDEGNCRIEYYR